MKKQNLKYIAACAALMTSGSVFAGASGNVGAVSEYMFRGIAQTGDAAIQGGLDYEHDSGWYIGTWASNIGFAGGTEQDFYTGFSKSFGMFGFDVGVTYYWYPEEGEGEIPGVFASEFSTAELYAGVSFGPVSVKYAYADEANFFIGDGMSEEAGYLSAALELPISDSLAFTASLGWYDGDEIERFLVTEDSYIDYSIGLSKSLDGGFGATFQYIATDIDVAGFEDDPKFVIGLSKDFDL